MGHFCYLYQISGFFSDSWNFIRPQNPPNFSSGTLPGGSWDPSKLEHWSTRVFRGAGVGFRACRVTGRTFPTCKLRDVIFSSKNARDTIEVFQVNWTQSSRCIHNLPNEGVGIFSKPTKMDLNKHSTTGGRSFSPWFNGQTGSAMGSCGQAELQRGGKRGRTQHHLFRVIQPPWPVSLFVGGPSTFEKGHWQRIARWTYRF